MHSSCIWVIHAQSLFNANYCVKTSSPLNSSLYKLIEKLTRNSIINNSKVKKVL